MPILRTFIALVATLLLGASALDCASEMSDDVEVALMWGQGSSSLTVAALQGLNGTYGAGCVARSGGWSLSAGSGGALPNPALSVVANNTACALTLTSVVASGQTYLASPPLTLGTAYAATAPSFALAASPIAFFGNAKLSSTAFSGAVVVTFLASADPGSASGTVSPTKTTHTLAGTVAGLAGAGLVLQNSGADPLSAPTNGSFTFPNAVVQAATYIVAVSTSPSSPTQSCAVTNGAATMGGSNVSNVRVTCAPTGVFATDSIVSTFAGHVPFAGGIGANAAFSLPRSVAVDASGMLYIADADNNRIRKLTPAGSVTTLAGSGTASYADGTGTAASFDGPRGIAFDSSGNVYVGDANNCRIRKITPAGVVTTLAGSGTCGFADGTGAAASFDYPVAVVVDAVGNVYVADSSNHRIRKITSGGAVTTLAGSGTCAWADGTGTAASFCDPKGLALDGAGNLYVGEYSNHTIRKVTAAGVVTTLAGSGSAGYADGTGAAASFNSLYGITLDASGNIYAADFGNNRIRKVTSAGVVTTLAGSGVPTLADGTGTSASFNAPSGVAIDGSGTIYVTDGANNRIRKVTPAGVVTTVAGSGGTTSYDEGTGPNASFNQPRGVALDASGNVFVADSANHSIRKIIPAGVVTTLAGSGNPGFANGAGAAATFYNPKGVAVDASGNVFVADTDNNSIRKVTSSGVVTTVAGSGTAGYADGTGAAAQFNEPLGLALDAAGNLYVADGTNNCIRKITAAGVVTTFAGSGSGSFADGTGTAASFSYPTSVAVDASGTLYVADESNNRIRKVTSARVVTTLAGSGSAAFADGAGATASFKYPFGVALDASGNVYVGDEGNNRIRKVTPAGTVTTIAGSGNTTIADGAANLAGFDAPKGLAVDASGNVYVADKNHNSIRIVTPSAPGRLVTQWNGSYDTNGTSFMSAFTATATAAGQPTRACSVSNAASQCIISSLMSGVTYAVSVTGTDAAGSTSPASVTVTAVAP